jgi:hypothetical protein
MYASAYCSDECTFAQTAANLKHQQRKDEAAAAARLRAALKPAAVAGFACTLCGRLWRSAQSLSQHAKFCKLVHERRQSGASQPRAKRFKVSSSAPPLARALRVRFHCAAHRFRGTCNRRCCTIRVGGTRTQVYSETILTGPIERSTRQRKRMRDAAGERARRFVRAHWQPAGLDVPPELRTAGCAGWRTGGLPPGASTHPA